MEWGCGLCGGSGEGGGAHAGGVVVVARSKEDCYVECASVFLAVVQRNTGSAHQDQPESDVMQ